MSNTEPTEQPEPKMDAPPDAGPGGPADMTEHDKDDLPPATPDQPRSAQVEKESVPDEIEEPEEIDAEEKDVEPGTEEPA